MVRVPISQGNRVQVQSEPRERFQYQAPRNLVGPAIEGFGQQLGQAAKDFDAIEATYDEADALRIENEYRAYERERLRTGQNAYLGTKGFTAGEQMQPTVQDLRKGADNLLTGARSQRARNMAKRALDLRVGASEETVATHSLAEMTSARIGQSEARIDGETQDAVESYGTDRFDVHLGVVEMETHELGRLQGWTDEQIKDAVGKQTSAIHRAVNENLLVNDDVDGAVAHLEAHKGEMRIDDEMAVRRALKPKLEFRQSEEDAGLVLGLLDDASVPAPKDDDGQPIPSPSLSTQFKAIEHIESRGNQSAVSPKGATGVMQVMPSTGPEAAKLAGLKWDPNRFRNDEDYNRALGQAYYREQLRQFDGHADLAAAAYNAGPGTVRKALRQWGPDWQNHVPAETQQYVQNFRKRTGIADGTIGSDMRNADGRVDATEAYHRLDEIAERDGWTPERAERARERIAVRIGRDDALKSREESAQWDAALVQVDALGDNFTDVSKINGFANLPPDRRLQLRNMAETNRKALEHPVEANSDTAVALGVMAIEQPEEFARTDLREYKGKITPAEFERFRLRQSTIAKAPHEEVSLRTGISATIGYLATEDMKLLGDKHRDERLRVMDAMETYIRGHIPDVKNGKRTPSDAEYRDAFQYATQKVVVGKTWYGADKEQRRFEKPYFDVPRDERIRIVTAWRRVYGRAPSNEEVIGYYNQHKGR